MSLQPHDGSADDGLSDSLLRFIDDGQLEPLRQALSGFNHRCRNMLNSMKMGFYLTRRSAAGPLPERWEELSRTYTEVERLFDLLQSIYRTMSLTRVRHPFSAIVDEFGEGWISTFDRADLTLTITPPEREEPGEFDAMRLASALDAFVAWRAATLAPGGEASLSWSTSSQGFHVEWRESPSEMFDATPRRPSSPDEALAATARSLALPLLARVVAEHHGRVSWSSRPRAHASIQWPLRSDADPPPAHDPCVPLAQTVP